MGQPLILALDQGTTSTRAILFQADGKPVCDASRPLRQSYPRDGWVEHAAEEIYAACVGVLAARVLGRRATTSTGSHRAGRSDGAPGGQSTSVPGSGRVVHTVVPRAVPIAFEEVLTPTT